VLAELGIGHEVNLRSCHEPVATHRFDERYELVDLLFPGRRRDVRSASSRRQRDGDRYGRTSTSPEAPDHRL